MFKYPAYLTSQRKLTKQVIIGLFLTLFCVIALFIFELSAYFTINNGIDHKALKLERYKALNEELAQSGSGEEGYIDFKAKLGSVKGILSERVLLEQIFDHFENNLDASSYVKRIQYDLNKKQHILVITENSTVFEQSTLAESKQVHNTSISILSKQIVKGSEATMLYELGVAL